MLGSRFEGFGAVQARNGRGEADPVLVQKHFRREFRADTKRRLSIHAGEKRYRQVSQVGGDCHLDKGKKGSNVPRIVTVGQGKSNVRT